MQPTAVDLSTLVAHEAFEELNNAWRKIEHCIGQLDNDQLWDRPDGKMNSVANLLLHLNGNVKQWLISGLGGTEDTRDRPLEFSQRERIPRDELLTQLDATLLKAKAVLVGTDAAELLRRRRIQGFDVSGLQAIFETVAHFRGHSQEIVHMTRRLIRDNYRFDFVPSTPEQGAPAEASET